MLQFSIVKKNKKIKIMLKMMAKISKIINVIISAYGVLADDM